MQNWLNNPEVSARNKEALEIFNEAARVGWTIPFVCGRSRRR